LIKKRKKEKPKIRVGFTRIDKMVLKWFCIYLLPILILTLLYEAWRQGLIRFK